MKVLDHRVRFNEVDAQGIVFNSHYLTWCDHAVYEFFRMNGWSPLDLMDLEVDFVLKKVEIDYHSSAKLDDMVQIVVNVKHIGNSSFRVKYTLTVTENLLCSIEILYVNVWESKAKQIPEEIKSYLYKFNV